jgi:hypothetical protein
MQFEFMSQHLVFANCIPLVLKFFNQNIMAYIQSKNNIALLDFPSCVIGTYLLLQIFCHGRCCDFLCFIFFARLTNETRQKVFYQAESSWH